MSEDATSQLDDTFVTRVLNLGVPVVLGFTPSAAKTSVSAELRLSRRSYQETLRFPLASELRKAGRKCKVPFAESLLSFTGAVWTGVRLTRSKL